MQKAETSAIQNKTARFKGLVQDLLSIVLICGVHSFWGFEIIITTQVAFSKPLFTSKLIKTHSLLSSVS